MKTRLCLALVSGFVLSTAAVPQEVQQQQDLATRVKTLEDEVKDLRGMLTTMATEQRSAGESTRTFFAAQVQAVGALRTSLEATETKGFTAGINPGSREELLAGMRAYLAGLEGGVPAAAREAESKKAAGSKPGAKKSGADAGSGN